MVSCAWNAPCLEAPAGQMGLARSLRLLLVLGLGSAGCAAPADPGEDIDSVELGATSSKLRASKWVKLWSDLPKERGGTAHFRACAGDSFKFTLSFRNMGSAIWRDVPGRGEEVGSDVFLETANGKKDGLTGKTRFSLRWNANDWVRGDRKAKECTMNRGCRRTRAVHDGIKARAPAKPGIYKSRWRLRDYSEAWSAPQGFGPKAEVRVRVEQCAAPGECACKVACSDGTGTTLFLMGGSEATCKTEAQLNCLPYEVTSHDLGECNTGGAGGSGGTSATNPDEVNAEAPPDGPGFWITDSELASGGSGGSGGTGGSSAAGGAAGAEWWGGEDDPGVGTDDLIDDPDYQPDGFDGVAEDVSGGVVPADEGCSFAAPHRGSAPLALAGLLVLGALLRRRSGQNAS